MEKELKHFSHEHLLVLKAEEHKIDDGTHHPDTNVTSCDGCGEPILGPFYSCGECVYVLHKVCAELPTKINYPMHPEHPLTLLSSSPYGAGGFLCNMCRRVRKKFVYNCSLCEFDVDMMCASASHSIEDKCHQHPLITFMLPISFPCDICLTEVKSISYKCNICPFWVHQNCTVSLPSTVKHSYHLHLLTFSQSISQRYQLFSKRCDICYDRISTFQCIYYCEPCLFFAHVDCARSEEAPPLTRSRLKNIEFNQDLQPALLPVQQKTTDLISWFAENYSNRDPITNLILGFDESFIYRDNKYINKEIKFFSHAHPLILVVDQVSEVICDACALPIFTSCYNCINCGYYIHKWCAELPKEILHPAHPQHQISLYPGDNSFLECNCCYQWSNGFGYKCFRCDFCIDIKCASLSRPVKHVAHKHPLITKFTSLGTRCSACESTHPFILQCSTRTCHFSLCFCCAMAPPMMKHRYDVHPFMLTYSPPENHYNDYICDLCEEDLNPKHWFYHCRPCDQFTHINCMRQRGVDSNIKYGKSYKFKVHEHELTLVSCTYSSYFCKKCSLPMRTGYSIGLECIPCAFRIHLLCALNKFYKNVRN